jgi:hypothetical protein
MIDLSSKALQEVLRSSNHRVYVTCVGEDGFPNVSVRKVEIREDSRLEYIDSNSRTVQLMIKHPQIIINVLNPVDPFHGYKIKGNASFHQIEPNEEHNFTPIKIVILLKEGFPY